MLSHSWTPSLEACKVQNLVLCNSDIPCQGVPVNSTEQFCTLNGMAELVQSPPGYFGELFQDHLIISGFLQDNQDNLLLHEQSFKHILHLFA